MNRIAHTMLVVGNMCATGGEERNWCFGAKEQTYIDVKSYHMLITGG